MVRAAAVTEIPQTNENFAKLLKRAGGREAAPEGSVVKGTILSVDSDTVLIDMGFKSEGRVALKEFFSPANKRI